MDKASDFESEDCEFESRRGRTFLFILCVHKTRGNTCKRPSSLAIPSLWDSLYFNPGFKILFFTIEQMGKTLIRSGYRNTHCL